MSAPAVPPPGVTVSPPARARTTRRPAATERTIPLSLAERSVLGRAARTGVPRRVHGEWAPAGNRPDPVEILETQARTRLAEFVPIRYGRMLASPFTFFRGAAAIMAADLSDGPRTGLHAQLCGDAHLSNFGVFNAPDRQMVFDINDFDETLPGPFEWDVKRLTASFEIAGRSRGFDASTRAAISISVVRAYRTAMRSFASMGNLDLWYARMDIQQRIARYLRTATATQVARTERNMAKVRTKDSRSALTKLTTVVDGQRRIRSDPPVLVPLSEMLAAGRGPAAHDSIAKLIRDYAATLPSDRRRLIERYRYVDAAHRIVGVGSVGTRAWIVLLLGRDDEDPLILQVKEAQASVLEPYLGKSSVGHAGRRVVDGQQIIQEASDILLGWLQAPGTDGVERDFYVRQLWDAKGSAQVDELEPDAMSRYGRLCGWTLAKAHARSGDAVAIDSYLGTRDVFDTALAAFASTYADQNERDFESLRSAVQSGRVIAQTGI